MFSHDFRSSGGLGGCRDLERVSERLEKTWNAALTCLTGKQNHSKQQYEPRQSSYVWIDINWRVGQKGGGGGGSVITPTSSPPGDVSGRLVQAGPGIASLSLTPPRIHTVNSVSPAGVKCGVSCRQFTPSLNYFRKSRVLQLQLSTFLSHVSGGRH